MRATNLWGRVHHDLAAEARDLLLFLCNDNLNFVWSQPERIETVGCRRSNAVTVLSDAAGENKQVHSAQQSHEGADCFSH